MQAVPLLLVLLLLSRWFSPSAAAQSPAAAPPDSAAHVAAQTAYLTDALWLSARQRPRVAALLRQQLSCPARPVPPAAWLRVLTLHQYQVWQQFGTSAAGPNPGRRPAPLAPTAVALARGSY